MVHGLSYPNGRATRQIAEKFVWTNMNKNIIAWTKACFHYQQSKVTRHNRLIPEKLPIPDARFERLTHVHLDLIGSLLPSRGFRYCLTLIDRFS